MSLSSIEYPELGSSEKGEPLFKGNFDLIKNAEVTIDVVVGSKVISVEELYSLKRGSVISLDQLLNEPVALLVDGNTVAYGELVAVDDSFGLKITDIDQ